MTRKKKAAEVAPVVVAYKGFDKGLQCRDYQFEIGKAFVHDGPVKHCKSGFHACENPLDVFGYYGPGSSRFALVELSGELSRETDGDSKIAAGSITIKAELKIPELVSAAITWVASLCKAADSQHATGDQSASSATGDQSASSATGDQSASSATGEGSVAMSIGRSSSSSAAEGGAIVCVYRDANCSLVHIRASKVGENGIEPNIAYTLDSAGEFVAVSP
jgi:hypothetical protein